MNTVNVETIREAKRRPERHKNLIVLFWGWSGQPARRRTPLRFGGIRRSFPLAAFRFASPGGKNRAACGEPQAVSKYRINPYNFIVNLNAGCYNAIGS